MNFLEVYGQAVAVKDALTAGNVIDAWEKSMPLQTFGQQLARSAGLKADPADGQVKADITACLKECELICTQGSLKSGATGAIGDGKILQLLLQIFTVIGPFFL